MHGAHDSDLLRAANLDDLADLLRLAREFYDEDGFTTTDAELERNFRALFGAGDSAHLCLAVDDGSAIGFALTTTGLVLESGLVAELQDLYVMPAHRGSGIGVRLIREAQRWATDQGATLLEIVVAPNGQDISGLIDYYARHGFRDEGRRLLSVRLS